MLTYEYTDALERAAARALLGEAAISGKLPVTLPGLFSAGHGLDRPAPSAPAP
jgi:beta-N-acetylhexosaminidase